MKANIAKSENATNRGIIDFLLSLRNFDRVAGPGSWILSHESENASLVNCIRLVRQKQFTISSFPSRHPGILNHRTAYR